MKGVKGRSGIKKIFLALIAVAAVVSSILFWTRGFIHSPLFDPRLVSEEKFIQDYIQANGLDHQKEKILAESYWLRYPDVRDNSYWGVNGPMGIWGPRDHFLQHGKREGRIFAPVAYPQDLEAEKKLAEAYWQRYPAIRNSPVWGENSRMGILGPRDHYQHLGRQQGNTWGLQEQESR